MQQVLDTQGLQAVGWRGFLDYPYLLEALAALLLATALGALLAYHPAVTRTIDTAEEAELPKVSLLYALVGAIVGVVVLEYGLVVGFVVFGLGGLMRFRTDTASTRDTGRLIAVTLIGLIAGLNLPHFAVLAALFAWVLIWVVERGPICTLEIEEAPKGRVKESAEAYRAALAALGCAIVSENTSYAKSRIRFVLRAPARGTHAQLHAALCERVPADLRGEIDWEVS